MYRSFSLSSRRGGGISQFHSAFHFYAMKPNRQFARCAIRRHTALLFVLVIAVFGFVQAVHFHRGLTDDGLPNPAAAHCSSCVASHSVAVTTDLSFRPVLAHQPGTVQFAEPQLEACLVIFTAFTRPPPSIA
jgi:hypothetical protein